MELGPRVLFNWPRRKHSPPQRFLSKCMSLLFIRTLPKSLLVYSIAATILVSLAVVRAQPTSATSVGLFPTDVGSFHLAQPQRPLTTLARNGLLRSEYFSARADAKSQPFSGGEAEYISAKGGKLLVELVRFQTDSEAYSLLTLSVRKMSDAGQPLTIRTGEVGTATVVADRTVLFFRGTTFVRITDESGSNARAAIEFGLLFAATLDTGDDEVPVLVKHLPDWINARQRAIYATTISALRDHVSNQPVLDAVSFDGGTEAVIANYGQSQLVIVEFTTPQFSIDNDSRIWTKIAELKTQGQSTPTAYRRVGNYSVFVFNAPDEKTANALVDQVKYEKVVQWLGDDPHLYERLQRYFTQTSAGVLVAVLKSSGLSLLLCLAAGGLIGAMLFRHRRAQRAAAYSDAGGSIRLNLDDLTGPANTQRLLKGGSSSDQSSNS